MQIKSKYKIARRLGPEIFDKTSTPKFSLREEQRKRGRRGGRRPRARTDYAIQLLEKQKARYTYGVSERQFSKYVAEVLAKKHSTNQNELLFQKLEARIDNVIYRLGLAQSRRHARQIVSHGHIVVNKRRTTVPSRHVEKGDVIAIRQSSQDSTLFANLTEEELSKKQVPSWLSFDAKKKEAKVEGEPKFSPTEIPIDLTIILEFYKR